MGWHYTFSASETQLQERSIWLISIAREVIDCFSIEDVAASQKARKPKRRVGEPSPRRDQVGTAEPEGEATHCSFSGPIQLETVRWLESAVQEVQCPTCGSVSKAKLKEQSVVIAPHPPRKSRPVRNVTRWIEQGTEWVLVQKKDS